MALTFNATHEGIASLESRVGYTQPTKIGNHANPQIPIQPPHASVSLAFDIFKAILC